MMMKRGDGNIVNDHPNTCVKSYRRLSLVRPETHKNDECVTFFSTHSTNGDEK